MSDEDDKEDEMGEPTFCFPDYPSKSADVHEPGFRYVRDNGDGTKQYRCPNCRARLDA